MSTIPKHENALETNDIADRFLQDIASRPLLAGPISMARQRILSGMNAAEQEKWWQTSDGLYRANAGPAVLLALWRFQAVMAPYVAGTIPSALASHIKDICVSGGTANTLRAIDAAAGLYRHGSSGEEIIRYLASISILAKEAPESVGSVTSATPELQRILGDCDLSPWITDGLRLYRDRRRRLAYFQREDPLSRERLGVHAGHLHFEAHHHRLTLLIHALWGFPFETQMLQEAGPVEPQRPRLSGNVVLMPERIAGIEAAAAKNHFEAAALHAAAHRRFTLRRFTTDGMKPVQLALTSLLEDARVERLAIMEFPGLTRLWEPYHRPETSRSRTIGNLFTRLSRRLFDPEFVDSDSWIEKASSLFDSAFLVDPLNQNIVTDIARILGHDLGQMRVPFDPKSYIVQPTYRDDGLGLFDFKDDPDRSETQKISLDAARLEQQETTDGRDERLPEEVEKSRSARTSAEELGTILGHYPEWDYRLNAEIGDSATVRDYPLEATVEASWIGRMLDEEPEMMRRIRAIVGRARLGKWHRLKRQLDGFELDIDAVQDAIVARRTGGNPDPRLYLATKRTQRDMAMALLIDISQSTEATLEDGRRMIATAALSAGALGQAIGDAGDPVGLFAFSSNGADDVRLTTIKNMAEDNPVWTSRLSLLRPGFSTRLGPALRHVAGKMRDVSSLRKVLIVLTDGEPADIDIDDPRYLVEDARHAVALARAQGVDIFCVALGSRAYDPAVRVFGKSNTLSVERVPDLPSRLAALYCKLAAH